MMVPFQPEIIFRRMDHGASFGVGIKLRGLRYVIRFRNPFKRVYSQAEFERRRLAKLR